MPGSGAWEDSLEASMDVHTLIPGLTPLDDPKLQVITNTIDHHSFQVSWPAVSNAKKYQIQINHGQWVDASSPHTFTGLNEKTNYIVDLKAIGDAVTYSDSDDVSIVVQTSIDTTNSSGKHVSKDVTDWMDGKVIWEQQNKIDTNTEYQESVGLGSTVEQPIDLKVPYVDAVWYDEEALDPYERRGTSDISGSNY